MSKAKAAEYILPPALISRADLSRLAREVEALDNELAAQKVREKAKKQGYHLPTMSQSLNDFLASNEIDIVDDHVRLELKEHLRALKDKAPIIHMTFAVDADPEFLQQLVAWVRKEVHPQTLISVGLQPRIVGGMYMRTPNHVHDFTIRTLLKTKRDVMMHELEGVFRAG